MTPRPEVGTVLFDNGIDVKVALEAAVVTGAASGIGRALATLLAEVGTRLILADIDEAGLEPSRPSSTPTWRWVPDPSG